MSRRKAIGRRKKQRRINLSTSCGKSSRKVDPSVVTNSISSELVTTESSLLVTSDPSSPPAVTPLQDPPLLSATPPQSQSSLQIDSTVVTSSSSSKLKSTERSLMVPSEPCTRSVLRAVQLAPPSEPSSPTVHLTATPPPAQAKASPSAVQSMPPKAYKAPTKCGRFFCNSRTHTDLCTVWSLIEEYVRFVLPQQWCAHVNTDGSSLEIMNRSERAPISIVKCLTVNKTGSVRIFIHGREVPASNAIYNNLETLPEVCKENVEQFCDSVQKIVLELNAWKVCYGADNDLYKQFWGTVQGGQIGVRDYNDGENMTIRAASCAWNVQWKGRAKRCIACSKLCHALNERLRLRRSSVKCSPLSL